VRAEATTSRRSFVVLAVAAACGVAILCGLGSWQLSRRAWKAELKAAIAERAFAPPVRLAREGDLPKLTRLSDEYRRVFVEGRFEHQHEAFVPSTVSGRVAGSPVRGYLVLTPLVRDDGSRVIVNRGFVPEDRRSPETRMDGQIDGPVRVVGLVRMPEERGLFTPADDPARDTFYARDPRPVATAMGLARVAPVIIDAVAGPDPAALPRGGQTRLELVDNHLQYAITWFSLAATLVVVLVAFVVDQRRKA
jgi:surfeit locus 1 family protein